MDFNACGKTRLNILPTSKWWFSFTWPTFENTKRKKDVMLEYEM
jgi:hypothetical protein